MNKFLYVDCLEDLSQIATEAACQSMHADHGQFYLLDEANEQLVEPASGTMVPVEGPGFAPWCVFHRATVLANHARDDERRGAAPNGTQVAAATPLMAEGRIIGALEVSRDEDKPFTAADEVTLVDLAQEVAVALVAVQLRDDLNNLLLHTGEWMVAAQESVAPGGRGHVFRLSQVCLALAEELAFAPADRHRMWLAARYHDLGWVLGGDLRTHAQVGARELKAVRCLENLAELVEQHHERFDGSGLPNGLAGEDMSLEACILSLAEDFDETLSAHRSDTPTRLSELVADFIHRQGSRHHPRVVAALDAISGHGKLRGLYLKEDSRANS